MYIFVLTLIQLNQDSSSTAYTRYTPCISPHDHLVSSKVSNDMKMMEFDSIHMYSHILVGAGQSVSIINLEYGPLLQT